MSRPDERAHVAQQVVSELKSLQFFQTQPHPCSYLPDQQASTIFLNPGQRIDTSLYSQLATFGFRRSGCHIYKPMCADCQACIPVRIPAHQFQANRQQRRTWKHNQDLEVHLVETIDTDEHYMLYEHYINKRHADGDMYPANRDQFRDFLTSEWHSSEYFEFRKQGRLLATSVADIMDSGISAVYTYFDPEVARRSLGTYVILYLIEQARQQQLAAVYLGYWIENSPKMHYKSAFRPLEILNGGEWLRVN